MRIYKGREARNKACCLVNRKQIAGQQFSTRTVEAVALDQTRHNGFTPADIAFFIQLECQISRSGKSTHTAFYFIGKTTAGGGQNCCLFFALGQGRHEDKPIKLSYIFTFHKNRSVGLN